MLKKILAISPLVLLVLIHIVLAQDTSLEVIIDNPQTLEEINTSNIVLSANMNKLGDMSYKLDNNNFTLACSNCTNFTKEITNLTNGQHIIHVLGQTENESQIDSVLFTINTNISQEEELEVTITKPQDQQQFNTTSITIEAEMNKQGKMSYKLDNNNFTLQCELCFSFTKIIETTEGTHQLFVMGETDSENKVISVFFKVNLTTPPDSNDSIPPSNNRTNESDGGVPRFSLGFQKLPKQFASGHITPEELTNLIKNNKLNPGIINRLAKTGKLTQENIDAIIETQFLPPGILNKLLGLIGFARNNNVEDFINNTNLTDEQLSKLIEKNKIPQKTIKKLVNEIELGEKSIDSLSKKTNNKILILLIKKQTLTSNNVKNILETNPSNKVIKELIENQILDEENIDTIISITQGNEINKYQKLTKKQKNKLNIKEEITEIKEQVTILGKQKRTSNEIKAQKQKEDKQEKSEIKSQEKIDKGKKDLGKEPTDKTDKNIKTNKENTPQEGSKNRGNSNQADSNNNKGNSGNKENNDDSNSGGNPRNDNTNAENHVNQGKGKDKP